MNTVDRSRQVSLGLAAVMMATVIVVFTFVIATAAPARGGIVDNDPVDPPQSQREVAAAASSGGVSSAITLQRPDEAPVANACGTVKASQIGNNQTFSVVVKNIASVDVVDGLAVFISAAPYDTNAFYFVNVLNGPGTNGVWHLDLKGKGSPPEQLDVSSVTDLEGHYVQIADVASNVFLETLIPPFVPSLRALSYRARSPLACPFPAPSARATGDIRVRLNGPQGSSVLLIRARHLSSGNSYCAWILSTPGASTDGDCPKTVKLVNGRALFDTYTARGEQMAAHALSHGRVRIDQYSGRYVEVRDQFGKTHLSGIIP